MVISCLLDATRLRISIQNQCLEIFLLDICDRELNNDFLQHLILFITLVQHSRGVGFALLDRLVILAHLLRGNSQQVDRPELEVHAPKEQGRRHRETQFVLNSVAKLQKHCFTILHLFLTVTEILTEIKFKKRFIDSQALFFNVLFKSICSVS